MTFEQKQELSVTLGGNFWRQTNSRPATSWTKGKGVRGGFEKPGKGGTDLGLLSR